MPHHRLPVELATPLPLFPQDPQYCTASRFHPGNRVRLVVAGDTKAARAKLAGIKAAIDAAGQAWRASAIRLAEQYLATILTRPFLTEDLRAYCYEHGLARPRSERAWGAVTLQLQRSGRIFAQGTAKVRNPKAHQANATSWSTVKPDQA